MRYSNSGPVVVMTIATSPPPQHGSRQRNSTLKRGSLRLWFGLILCFHAVLFVTQYHVWMHYSKVNTFVLVSCTSSYQQVNATTPCSSSSRRRLDDLLSKYNLTLPQHPKKVKTPDAERSMAFLHIGKTGGSTISMHIRNGCQEWEMKQCKNRIDGWIVNETVASYRIKSYHHMQDIPPEKLENYTTIVTTVRNPIKRFLSAFAYGHPHNAKATERQFVSNLHKYPCFTTVR